MHSAVDQLGVALLVDQAGQGGEGRARGTRHCFGPFLVIDLCVVEKA